MILSLLRNQKGVALISVYAASAFITALSVASFSRAFWETRHVEREITRIQGYAAAEAGIQSAMAQMAQNAYTGFINTTAIAQPNFVSVNGASVGSFNVTILYPDQADWVIIQSTGTSNGETKNLEGRVFLDSNLSKYLVYADANNFSSGDAQYGNSNGVDPQGVPANEDDRTMMYFTGNWTVSQGGMHLYGDALVEGAVSGPGSSQVHGDTYVQSFTQTGGGSVTNTGVSGGLVVGDGFSDDTDRNKDGVVNSQDKPDFHDLTEDGEDDTKAKETLVQMNLNFYAQNNNVPAFSSGAAQTRYLEFQPVSGTNYTRVVQYSSNYQNVIGSYTLPHTAIVYVNGDAYVRGEIQGRVSIASSDDIMLAGNISYTGNQKYADAYHSTAFLAKDKLFFMANDLEASGILYAENSSNSSTAFDAYYNVYGQSDPYSKDQLRLYGNRIIKGSTNLSYYGDRVYGYDPNLKYFRPPGIPVVPDLRTVRET